MHRLARSLCRPKSGQHFRAGTKEYELLGMIGDGAVGLVRKARDVTSEKLVAVKFLAPDPKYIDVEAFDEVAQRFRREGVRGAGLDHENLVKVVAYEDNSEGECFKSRSVKNPFIIMEFIRGSTLESLVRKLPQSQAGNVHITQQTLHIGACIARALQYLHDRKVTHRDVKPANVFVSTTAVGTVPTVVKLDDFGVTKWGDFLAAVSSGTLTATRQEGLGTLKYMSPEQAVRPKDVTVRSDIFSLGITLFEMFTGSILPSPHHVFEIMGARTSRSSITGKLYSLGVSCTSTGEEGLFELILDMFLVGPSGRPASRQVSGRLEYYLDRVSTEPER